MPSPPLQDPSTEPPPASKPAKSAVRRLSWSCRASAQLLSSALLRDIQLGKPFPPLLRHITVNLFDSVAVPLQLLSLDPAPTPQTAVHGAATSQTFLLPALPPSLNPHSLLPLPDACYLSGSHVPALLRLALAANTVIVVKAKAKHFIGPPTAESSASFEARPLRSVSRGVQGGVNGEDA